MAGLLGIVNRNHVHVGPVCIMMIKAARIINQKLKNLVSMNEWYKKVFFIFSLLALFVNSVWAAEQKYAVADIPKNLLTNAKAVVRDTKTQVFVSSRGKFVWKVYNAITILNKNGQDLASLQLPYTRNQKVVSIEASIYTSEGIKVRNWDGLKDYDFSFPDYGTLFTDVRYKSITPNYQEYPYTVVFEYSLSITNSVNYPDWHPIPDYNVSVENSEFEIQLNAAADFRYFERNITNPPDKKESSGTSILKWKLSGQSALIDEPSNPALNDLAPSVMLTPTQIDYDGYSGSFDSWENFGAWIAKLNEGKDVLPAKTNEEIAKLTAGIKDKRQKTKAVYEYMQNKTRYVSVQIGIGGFQPFDAETVDRLGYGDCKALSNYTKALLKSAGIQSNYVLVGAGSNKSQVVPEFPSNQFNHAILCVPMEKDTVWLECTSQIAPFNFLGDFTSGRHVLIIDDKKGTLARTPDFSNGKSIIERVVTFAPDAEGNGIAKVTTTYSGYQYDNYSGIFSLDNAEQKKKILKSIDIPNFVLSNYKITNNKEEPPSATEELLVNVSNYTTIVGNKVICKLNLMNQWDSHPFTSKNRNFDILFRWPLESIDSVCITIPEGYTADKLPADVEMKTSFGTYTAAVSQQGNQLYYTRHFTLPEGKFGSEKYAELVDFFEKLNKADAMKVVFLKVL